MEAQEVQEGKTKHNIYRKIQDIYTIENWLEQYGMEKKIYL